MDDKTDKQKKIKKEEQALREIFEKEEESIFRNIDKKYYRESSSGVRFR